MSERELETSALLPGIHSPEDLKAPPEPATVRDLLDGSVAGENVRTFDLPMVSGETRLFALLTP